MEKFSELTYVRPSLEETQKQLQEQLEHFLSAATYDEAKEAFLKRQEINNEFRTMNVIASIRTDMNTADEFYAGESAFFHAANPELAVTMKAFNEAFVSSPFRPDFEKEFGPQLFRLRKKLKKGNLLPHIPRQPHHARQYFVGKNAIFTVF